MHFCYPCRGYLHIKGTSTGAGALDPAPHARPPHLYQCALDGYPPTIRRCKVCSTQRPFTHLQDVRHRVVGHVDGGVGQRLDEVLRVPRQAGAQAEGAAARPLLQPACGGEGEGGGGVTRGCRCARVCWDMPTAQSSLRRGIRSGWMATCARLGRMQAAKMLVCGALVRGNAPVWTQRGAWVNVVRSTMRRYKRHQHPASGALHPPPSTLCPSCCPRAQPSSLQAPCVTAPACAVQPAHRRPLPRRHQSTPTPTPPQPRYYTHALRAVPPPLPPSSPRQCANWLRVSSLYVSMRARHSRVVLAHSSSPYVMYLGQEGRGGVRRAFRKPCHGSAGAFHTSGYAYHSPVGPFAHPP